MERLQDREYYYKGKSEDPPSLRFLIGWKTFTHLKHSGVDVIKRNIIDTIKIKL